MSKFKISEEKCIRCGACASTCPEGVEWGEEDKPKIINDKQLEKCGGENVCPYGAIEKEQ